MVMQVELSNIVDPFTPQNSRSSFFKQGGFDVDMEDQVGPTHGGLMKDKLWRSSGD